MVTATMKMYPFFIFDGRESWIASSGMESKGIEGVNLEKRSNGSRVWKKNFCQVESKFVL